MPDLGSSKQSLQRIVGIVGDFLGASDTQIITNKQFDVALNNLIQTTPGLGAILADNGTKIVARARGAANLPLKVKSDGSDIEYAKLDVPGGGTGATSLTGVIIGTGTTAFVPKANPAGAFLGDTDIQAVSNKIFDHNINTVKNEASQETIFCYKDPVSGLYRTRNTKTGAIVASSADPDGPISTAMSTGTVRFSSDNFIFSSGFTGVTIPVNTSVFAAAGTFFTVPQGYTGHVFKMASGAIWWRGGQFLEAGTPSRLWTPFKLESSSSTGVNVGIEAVKIYNAGTGMLLLVSNVNGFVNSCYLADIQMFDPVIGFDFQNTGVTWNSSMIGPLGQNLFNSCWVQCGSHTLYGFKNIQNSDNVFIGCKTWDSQLGNGGAGCFRSTFHADNIAGSNIIIGGIMTGTLGTHWLDPSASAFVVDQFTGFRPARDILGNLNLGNNVYQIISTQARIKQGGTSQFYIRNGADSAYGNLRLENLQAFSYTTQDGTVALMTTTGNILKILEGYVQEKYNDKKIITIPSDPASGYVREYPKAPDANNDGYYMKIKQQGAVEELAMIP